MALYIQRKIVSKEYGRNKRIGTTGTGNSLLATSSSGGSGGGVPSDFDPTLDQSITGNWNFTENLALGGTHIPTKVLDAIGEGRFSNNGSCLQLNRDNEVYGSVLSFFKNDIGTWQIHSGRSSDGSDKFSIQKYSDNTKSLTIDYSTGFVGIGINYDNTITQAIDVVGGAKFTSHIKTWGSGDAFVTASVNGSDNERASLFQGTSVGGGFSAVTGGSEQIRLSTFDDCFVNRNLSIGKTTAATQALDVSGAIVSTGVITSGSRVDFNSVLRSTDNEAILGTNASGEIILRPDGWNSSFGQSSFTNANAYIGTDLKVNSNANPAQALDVDGNGLFSGWGQFGTYGQLGSSFVTGYTGIGTSRWYLSGGETTLEVDNLRVRRRMDAYELVINKIRATNGSLWVSDAGKVETVSGTNPYTVTVDDDITFVNGDKVRCQVFTGTNIKFYEATVSSVTASNFVLTRISGSSPVEIGDTIVRVNSSVSTRQGALYLTSSDSGSPYMDVVNNEVSQLRVGNIDGYHGNSGFGIAGTDKFHISSDGTAKIAGWDFDNAKLNSGTDIVLDGSGKSISVANGAVEMFHTSGSDYGIKDSAGIFQLGSTNEIAGWTFDGNKLYTGSLFGFGSGIELNQTSKRLMVYQNVTNYVSSFYTDSNNWGIEGYSGGNQIFQLGSTNQIAGWGFDNDKIFSELTEINKDGNIYLGATDGTTFNGLKFKSGTEVVAKLNTTVGALNGSTWSFTKGATLSAINDSYTSGNEPTTEFGETSITVADAGTSSENMRVIYLNGTVSSRGKRARPGLQSGTLSSSDIAQYDIFRTTSSTLTLPSPTSGRDSSGNFYYGKEITIINQSSSSSCSVGNTAGVNAIIEPNRTRTFIYAEGAWFASAIN